MFTRVSIEEQNAGVRSISTLAKPAHPKQIGHEIHSYKEDNETAVIKFEHPAYNRLSVPEARRIIGIERRWDDCSIDWMTKK